MKHKHLQGLLTALVAVLKDKDTQYNIIVSSPGLDFKWYESPSGGATTVSFSHSILQRFQIGIKGWITV